MRQWASLRAPMGFLARATRVARKQPGALGMQSGSRVCALGALGTDQWHALASWGAWIKTNMVREGANQGRAW